jgi:hypothetical protein
MTGSKRVVHRTSETWCECSEIAGSPQGTPPAADYVGCEAERRTCSERETVTEALCEINWDPGKARLRRGHSDHSCQGHQCSETTLTGKSRFHVIPSLGFEPGSLVTESKRVVHWISETWCEFSEIAGSPHAY